MTVIFNPFLVLRTTFFGELDPSFPLTNAVKLTYDILQLSF
jgi:hypothetical protein